MPPGRKEATNSSHVNPVAVRPLVRRALKPTAILNENEAQHKGSEAANKARPIAVPRRTLKAGKGLLERRSNVSTLAAEDQSILGGIKEKLGHATLRFGGGSTLMTVDYADDIDKYMRHLEMKQSLPANFLANHSVDGRMRQILVDWILHVQRRFTLLNETLSLAVWIIDHALVEIPINKSNLQLLGVAGVFVAAKFEEISVPNIGDFVYVAAEVFTKKDVLRMEQSILRAIGFKCSITHSCQFLRRYRFHTSAPKNVHNLAKYISEVALITYSLAHYKPSTVAAVSYFLSARILDFKLPLAPAWQELIRMDEGSMLEVARQFIQPVIHMASSYTKQYALRDKYQKDAPIMFTEEQLRRLRQMEKTDVETNMEEDL